ncbi:MAG TPA: hypothetical protein VKS78_10545 [Roseiarcus sp.]|nr:hypothetical protein [Roseiarcus sp.]
MSGSFGEDERGSAVEKFAVAAGLAALAALSLGSTVERMASNGGLPTIALLSPDQYVATKPKANDPNSIDYTVTGSINSRGAIDGCPGRHENP